MLVQAPSSSRQSPGRNYAVAHSGTASRTGRLVCGRDVTVAYICAVWWRRIATSSGCKMLLTLSQHAGARQPLTAFSLAMG